jgi:hypothetical protein
MTICGFSSEHEQTFLRNFPMSDTTDQQTEKKERSNKKEAVIVAALFATVIALLYYIKPTSIPFKSFTQSDVLTIVTSIFVVAIFMERSIAAILIPIRAPARQKIEQKLELLKPSGEDEPIDAETEKKIRAKEHELAAYKLQTAQRAYWLSFGFGLAISLVGVRTLAGLVEPGYLTNLAETKQLHYTFFSFVDIVLTGGVISGGSAAIDMIGRKISTSFDFSSAVTQH